MGFLVTPAIHGSHHSRDARFAEKNFGAMLGIWDRLFGTWCEPAKGEALRADVPSICRTHDGVTTQWNLTEPTGPTPAGWSATVGVQYQLDIGPSGTSLDEWFDGVKLTIW